MYEDILTGDSLSTLEQRLKEWGIKRKRQTLSDQQLEFPVREIKRQVGVFHGERAIMGILAAMDHWVPRQTLREVIRRVDPEGVDMR